MSWEQFEERRKRDRERGDQPEERSPAQVEWEKKCAALFGSGLGAEVLQGLRNRTVEVPTSPQISQRALRSLEGQRNFVRVIEAWVRRGQDAS